MPTPSDRPSYRWLTVTVAVALGVYAWYATSQFDRLNELNHRQLSNAGAELKTAVGNAVVTVEEFNRRWAKSPSPKPLVCNFVQGQPYLELDGCGPESSPDDVKWAPFTTAQATTDSGVAIKVSGAGKTEARFRYRTDKLVQELAFYDAFALVFVANEDGVVLFEDAPARRQWLRQLRWGEQTFRDVNVDRPPTLQIHNVEQLVGGKDAWARLKSVSSRTTVSLAGMSFQLYLQPLAVEGEHPLHLVIGAAVPRSTVMSDSLALGAPMVGVMAFLLLLALLGFPFVKLAVLDRCEHFSRNDILGLYASSGALLVLFTCASLALDGYTRWNLVANQGLEPFATHLEGRFRDEVSAIRDQLVAYDRQVSAWGARDCQRWPVRSGWFQQERDAADALPWPPGLHMRTVAWVDPSGWQVWKSTADTIPGKTFVGHRAYFRAVRDDSLVQIDGDGRPIFLGPDRSIADGKFYTFVSMRSQIGIDRMCRDRKDASGPLVMSATVQLLSLDRQPLPSGYGFALVNREGRVLYHSDGRLSLRENLFEELAEGGRARAMMYAGARGGLDTRYRERPHYFHLQPVSLARDGSPPGFYLAVFRDTSVEQALLSHVFVVGMIGPMALLGGLGTLLLIVLRRAARRRHHSWLAWLWPHRALDRVYKAQAGTFLAVLVLGATLYVRYDSITLFLLTPVLAFVLGGVIHWALESPASARQSLCRPIWQRASVFLALVCMVVVPTGALFRLALSHEFAKLILTEQQWIAAQVEDAPRAAMFEALDERYSPPRAREIVDARAVYAGCIPAPFDALGTPRVLEAPVPPAPEVLRASYVPTETAHEPAQRAAVLSGCVKDASGRALEASALTPLGARAGVIQALHWLDELLPLRNDVLIRQHFQPDEQAYSPHGTFVRSVKASEVALGGLALTLALLLWWIGWNTNRLFLANLDGSADTPSQAFECLWDDCEFDEQMVLVQIAHERIANPYQRPIVEKLLTKGLLRFAPDVQPFSPEFGDFLQTKERALTEKIAEWELVHHRHSWRYSRMILIAAGVGIGSFLVVTQPGLQSNLVGIATGVTTLLTAGYKFRDAVFAWFGGDKKAA